MHQFCLLKHAADSIKRLLVRVIPIVYRGVFESGSSNSILADKVHQDHIVLENVRHRAFDSFAERETLQISDFFLGPQFDHLAWISFTVAVPEPILACHVPLSVLENQN